VIQNVTAVVEENPDITFYFFITPYSVCFWDEQYRAGRLHYMFEAEKIMIEEVLKYDNVRLFSFTDHYEWTCNLELYEDQAHYSPEVNSGMIRFMKEGKCELTTDNYQDYMNEVIGFYSAYDYEQIYQ